MSLYEQRPHASKVGSSDPVSVEEIPTAISEIDGTRGRILVRGHELAALAAAPSFERTWAMLLELEGPADTLLADARRWSSTHASSLSIPLQPDTAMDALRAGVSQLALPSPSSSELPNSEQAALVTAGVSQVAAAWMRRQRERDGTATPAKAIPARAETRAQGTHGEGNVTRNSHAEAFLATALGRQPSRMQVHALDTYWTTVAEHGLNASTYAARVVASTSSDLVSAVTAAIGALKGPLHGGAPGPVLDMLEAIGSPAQARPWLECELEAGRRIMGMGHRVYRVRDPRAAILEQAHARLLEVEPRADAQQLAATARAVEQHAADLLRERHPERPLCANVEFYTALLLDALGFHRREFTLVFAAARVAGWCAHVMEQQRSGRLIRPAGRYIGPRPPGTTPNVEK